MELAVTFDLVRQLGMEKLQLIRYSKEDPDAFLRTLRRYSQRSFSSYFRLITLRVLLFLLLTLPILPYMYYVASSCLSELNIIKAERQKRIQLEKTLEDTQMRLNELLKKSILTEGHN